MNETPPLPLQSRTPENANYTAISYGGGLKFTYEAQPSSNASTMIMPTQLTTNTTPILKESPPSSPGSEAGSKKRNSGGGIVNSGGLGGNGKKLVDTKDVKLFQNGVVATHMLGNQLNPASSVAQKFTDQLNMEIEAHSIYTAPSIESGPQLLGPPFPGKITQSRLSVSQPSQQQPLGNLLLGGGGVSLGASGLGGGGGSGNGNGGGGSSSSSSQSGGGGGGNIHQSLEQLLERQWEQGSQFLMEQAQHFDSENIYIFGFESWVLMR